MAKDETAAVSPATDTAAALLALGIDAPRLLGAILPEYELPLHGDHGINHWARVLENGLAVAAETAANRKVVALFALFHDARRVNEYEDPGHGLRGGKLARTLRGPLLSLTDAEFDLLYEACRLHTDGLTDGDVTLQTCWDADRLDLGRVGITPRPHRLCTDAARRLLKWADGRACLRHVPPIVTQAWQL